LRIQNRRSKSSAKPFDYFFSFSPQGHFDVARTLLVQARPKPNVDYQNSNGGTALMMAAGAGKLECVRLLLAHGARHDLLTGMVNASIRHLQIRA
jgi:ankyrin repeat protein